MNGLIYLLQVNFYLLAFYAFYRLVLSKETFFTQNRFYLIGTTLLSFGIPVLQSDWLKDWFAPKKVQQVVQQFNSEAYELFLKAQPEIEQINIGEVLSWVYFTVVGILVIRLAYRLTRAYRWVRNPQGEIQACSFFGYIAVDDNLEGREAIMVHEQVHAQQLHSADILFFELNTIINWFNPIAYLFQNEIRKIHEYIADEAASETLSKKSDYALLLFHENFGVKPQELTNSFFNQSILKQRIMMLQKDKSKKVTLLKYGLIAPLFLGMLVLSSAFVSKQTTQQIAKSVLTDTIPTPPIPPNPPKPEAPKKALKLGIKGDDNLIYIVNGKEISVAELKKIDKNSIRTIDIKGKAMVINLKPATAIGDSSATQQNAEFRKWVEGEKLKEGVIVIKPNTKKGYQSDSNKPLTVIDGKLIEAGFDMNTINPNAIESISVLKGESAVKAYGKAGKNGVIQITLKK
jgi:hypothetical protein